MTKSVSIKISKFGYGVENAADYQQLFTSEWPLLKIAFEGSFTIPQYSGFVGSRVVVKNHNLGFYPAFIYSLNSGDINGGVPSKTSMLGVAAGIVDMSIDKNNLYAYTTDPAFAEQTIHYYIFYQDLEATAYKGNVISTSGSSSQKIIEDYQVKVSKPGKSINSSDLRDYTIHSGANNLPIHMFGNTILDSSNNYTLTIKHDLGYKPIYYIWNRNVDTGFEEYDNSYFNTSHRAFSGTNTLTIRGVQGIISGYISYVVFKDPLLNQ